MAKSRKLEETLAELAQIRTAPTSEAGIVILRQVLKSKNSVAVAQAAKMVGEFAIAALRLYRQNYRLWQRVCQLIEERGNARLLKALLLHLVTS